MAFDQKRRYYRLEPTDTDPAIVHLKRKSYFTNDISITGLKIEVYKLLPEWRIGKVINITIELPNEEFHPRIHTKAKICYMDSTHLALEYVDLPAAGTRKISNYVLQLCKKLGYL